MKRLIPTTRTRAAWRLGLCLLVSSPLAAAEPDLLGRWWWNVFETPAEVRFNGGQLVGGDDFGVFGGAYEFSLVGGSARFQNLTPGEGDERGTFSVSDTLAVRQQFDQGGDAMLYGNQALDVMIESKFTGNNGPEFASLEILLRQPTPGLTPRSVLEKLGQMQMMDVHVPTNDGRELVMSRYTEPSADQRLLMDQLRLVLPEQPRPRITTQQVDLSTDPM